MKSEESSVQNGAEKPRCDFPFWYEGRLRYECVARKGKEAGGVLARTGFWCPIKTATDQRDQQSDPFTSNKVRRSCILVERTTKQ